MEQLKRFQVVWSYEASNNKSQVAMVNGFIIGRIYPSLCNDDCYTPIFFLSNGDIFSWCMMSLNEQLIKRVVAYIYQHKLSYSYLGSFRCMDEGGIAKFLDIVRNGAVICQNENSLR